MRLSLLALALVACKPDPVDTDQGVDTDVDTDPDTDSDTDPDTDSDTDTDPDTDPDTDTDPVDPAGLASAGGPPGAQVQRLSAAGSTVLAATYTGLWVSTDAGRTWAPDGTLVPTRIQAVAATPTTWVAGTDLGPLVSTDAGKTWTKVTSGLTEVNVTALSTDGAAIYALTNSFTANAYRLDGSAWTALSGPEPFNGLYADGDDLFGTSSFGSGVFASDDGGGSFAALGATSLPFGVWGAVARVGSTLIVGDQTSMWRWTGASWSSVKAPPKDTRGLGTWGGAWVAATWTGGVYVSADDGVTWSAASAGLPAKAWLPTLAVGDALVTAPYGDVPYVSTDAATWTASTGFAATTPSALALDAGVTLVTAGTGALWTYDGAWDDVAVDPDARLSAVAAAGGVWVVGSQDGVWRSTDGGAGWTEAKGIPTYNGGAGPQRREVARLATDGDVWLVGFGDSSELIGGSFTITGGGVARSTDGGATWTRTNTGLPSIGTSGSGEAVYTPVTALGVFDGVALVAAGEGFRSVDGGVTWARTSMPADVRAFAAFDGALFAAGPGVWTSTDRGDGWADLSDGLPTGAIVSGLAAHGGALVAVTRGDGVWRLDGATWTRVAAAAWVDGPLLDDGASLWTGSRGAGCGWVE